MDKSNRTISRRTIFGLSLADGLVTMMPELCLGGTISYFYLRNMGLKIEYEIIAWTIFAIWDALDNMLAGTISDRTVHKLGRRIPYIRICGPLMGLAFCASFLLPSLAHSQLVLTLIFFFSICCLDMTVAFLECTLFAIPFETTLSNRERGFVFLCEGIFDVVALIIPLVVVPELQPDVGEDTTMFRIVMVIVGVVSGLLTFLSSYLIKVKDTTKVEHIQKLGVWKQILTCLKNKPFLICEVYEISSMATYVVFIFGMYYYFDEVCNNSLPCYLAAAAGVVASLIVYWLLIDRLGVKILATFSCLFSGGLFLVAAFLGITPAAGILAFFAFGYAYIAYMIVFSLQFGETMDYDEYCVGFRREGTYGGFQCLFGSISNLAQPLFLIIITSFGYVSGQKAGTQTIVAQQGIMLGWLAIPAAALLISGFVTLWFYPLTRRKMQDIKAVLDAGQTSD